MSNRARSGLSALAALVAVLVLGLAGPAGATTHKPVKHKPVKHKTTKQKLVTADRMPGWWPAADVQQIHLSFGPIAIAPGQNNIKFAVLNQRPTVPGFIVSFKPNLVYTSAGGACTGKVPPVDVIHLHHGVWTINGRLSFAAGEEKTRMYSPKGFGYPYSVSDTWGLSYMIHNLTPNPTSVCLTYDLGFIAQTSPAAAGIIPVHTQWMTVIGGGYPVFDVHQHSGTNGKFTFPTQAKNPYGAGPKVNEWTVRRDATIVGMVGHLHPGGLYDSMWDTRVVNGVPRKVLLFNSWAHYFEPAGTVSWDVAMMGTPPDYRVAIKAGDVISVTATYNSAIGSWYEAMGIMPMQVTNAPAGGLDPFTTNVSVPGVLNHGHLPENDDHGGGAPILPDARKLPNGPLTDAGQLPIDNFVYGHGDLTEAGAAGRPPTIRQGQSLTFVNNDANIGPGEWHTITSCRAPCNAATGIAYPLANGPVDFDSGELGTGGAPTAGRTTWSTPTNLPAGTYNYFCRIHPFMRGAFRVLPAQ